MCGVRVQCGLGSVAAVEHVGEAEERGLGAEEGTRREVEDVVDCGQAIEAAEPDVDLRRVSSLLDVEEDHVLDDSGGGRHGCC